jgi:hypothetical protein
MLGELCFAIFEMLTFGMMRRFFRRQRRRRRQRYRQWD